MKLVKDGNKRILVETTAHLSFYFEEKAARLEYEDGLTREEAENEAFRLLKETEK